MDDTLVDSAFNLGLASALTLIETCQSYDEAVKELTSWLSERRSETTKQIPVTKVETTPQRVKVGIAA